MPLLAASLNLGKGTGDWDEELQLPSLDAGWTPEKRMRSGLQKQHRLRKGRACQAMLPWCFSMTSPGSVSHLLKPRRHSRDSHWLWILKKGMHYPDEKYPCARELDHAFRLASIPQQLSCFPVVCYHQVLPLKWSIFPSLCLFRDTTKAIKSFQLSVDLPWFNILFCYTKSCYRFS